MSSPSGSSSSQAAKRKRSAAANLVVDTADMMDLQTSSRDASGEEGDAATESGHALHQHRKSDSTGSSHPPKRLRASNSDHTRDPGEPSDTTEASDDIAVRVGARRGRRSTIEDDHVAATEQESMAPPPIGIFTTACPPVLSQ